MYLSKFLLPTLKETPSEAKIKSHKLMLKAGLIRKSSSGFYFYLPLGMRIINKITNIIREEMNKANALEILTPTLIPKELLEASERYEIFGDTMMRLKDRNNKEYILGPTHEENVSALIAPYIQSYKDLPFNLYQINVKFRDEIRPRFGVLRTREFIMKDAYSFHENEKCLDNTFKLMYKTYISIFKRCGLNAISVEASSGSMGGSSSQEFMIKSEVGEELIMQCPKCSYTANIETAYSITNTKIINEKQKELQTIDTPNKRTIKEITEFLNVPVDICIKSLIYKKNDGEFIMVLCSGNIEINEIKLSNELNGQEINLPKDEEVKEKFGLPVGYLGPINLEHDIRILADNSIKHIINGITGANLKDKHYINVNIQRDYYIDKFYDLRLVKENDPCPECKTPLKSFKGIEVGHIFKLGQKYTKAQKITFSDQNGKEQTPTMGSYGIGVNRIAASIIESNSDKDGIILPISIAPFHVIITPINFNNQKQMQIAKEIYKELINENIETIIDDRNLRTGFKFKDADLIGIPIRINVGDKGLSKECVEIKMRNKKETTMIPIKELKNKIINTIKENLKEFK